MQAIAPPGIRLTRKYPALNRESPAEKRTENSPATTAGCLCPPCLRRRGLRDHLTASSPRPAAGNPWRVICRLLGRGTPTVRNRSGRNRGRMATPPNPPKELPARPSQDRENPARSLESQAPRNRTTRKTARRRASRRIRPPARHPVESLQRIRNNSSPALILQASLNHLTCPRRGKNRGP